MRFLLMKMLNSPALYDADLSRTDISDWLLQNLYDSRSEISKYLANVPSSCNADLIRRTDVGMLKMIDVAPNMRNKT